MKRAWMVALMVLGISASGICADKAKTAGKAADVPAKSDVLGEPESKIDRRVQGMTTDLGLSKSQQDAVHKILQDAHDKNHAIRDEENAKHKAVKDDADAKIAALLKPDQKKKFDSLQEERSEGSLLSKDAKGN